MTIAPNRWFRFSLRTILLATALAVIYAWWLLGWPVESNDVTVDEYGKRIHHYHPPTLANIVMRIAVCTCYLLFAVVGVKLYSRHKQSRQGRVDPPSK